MKNKFILALFVVGSFIYSNQISAQNGTNSSKNVQSLIAKKRAFNKKYGFGYRVQIFYGSETRARGIKANFMNEFPDIYSKLMYDQPYWKVQVGNYKTKLEADKAVLKFKEKFSGIIVVPLIK